MEPRNTNLIRTGLIAIGILLFANTGRAEIIFDTGLLNFAATGTQFGRISRNGVASDWASPKPFPGVTGAPAARGYETFTVTSDVYSYLQISFDDPTVSLFASAYLNSYTPVNLSPNFGLNVNYLGDPGSSQPVGNPSFFQILVAPFANVVIPINEINPGGGADRPFELLVEGFYDADYNDRTTVPEPSSLMLLGTGAIALLAARRKRHSA
jgi:PEP-CTERM motif